MPDLDGPKFWELMDKMVAVQTQLGDLAKPDSKTPALLKPLVKVALYERMASLLLRVVTSTPLKDTGSWDFKLKSQLTY